MDSAETPWSDDQDGASERGATETPYLKQLKRRHRARARAAIRWRPRFLKAMAMSCSFTSALKAARVSYNTVRAHEQNDPEFAALVKEAVQEGAELLHHVCWTAAVEGNVEPVYFQGQVVGHVRKYDSRMQIEMLRAHMPNKFKAPGASGESLVGKSVGTLMVVGEAERDELVALRQESLHAIADAMTLKLLSEKTVDRE